MDKYDIIIQAGQSNAQGYGKGSVESDYRSSSDVLYLSAEKESETVDGIVRVKYADTPFSISIAYENEDAAGKTGDFSLAFAQDYIQNGFLEDGRKLLIIRAAVGGTGFSHGHWRLDGQQYLKMQEMIDYALGLSGENRLVAFLWHQGENDANCGMFPTAYHSYVKQMVTAIRNRYDCPKLPFVVGDFVPQWRDENRAKTTPIIKVLRTLCSQIGDAAFVETDGLLSNAQMNGGRDILHFCRQSLYDLGDRYFEAFSKIARNS